MKFSVLIPVYIKTKSNEIKDCLDSILNQTLKPNEIVILLDGPIKKEVKKI